MRYLFAVVGGMLARAAYGQVAVEVSAADSICPQAPTVVRWVSSRVDSTGACTEALEGVGPGAVVRAFYPSGRLKEYVPYANLRTGRRHGVATSWYDNGQLKAYQIFLDGQRDSTLALYYENGQLKRQTQYRAGIEQLGTCFAADGQPLSYFPYEQLPLYPGGEAQLTKELKRALRLPPQVSVYLWVPHELEVRFVITETGLIGRPEIVVSSHVPALDQAVLAAVAKLSQRFHPGSRDGVVVPCNYYLPLQFGRESVSRSSPSR